MSIRTESTALPPYEQLPASNQLSKVLEAKGPSCKTLHRLVEIIDFYLSSTKADIATISGAKDLCLKEFNRLLVKRRFGVVDGEYALYLAFEKEVDQELKRRGLTKEDEYDAHASRSVAKSAKDSQQRDILAWRTDVSPSLIPTEDNTQTKDGASSYGWGYYSRGASSKSRAPKQAGRPMISRIAGAAGMGLGAIVLAPVTAVAGVAGAAVKGATMIVGGVGDGLNATFNGGVQMVKDRNITAPVVGPVAAVAGIAGGAVSGVALITGGLSKGLFAAFDEGIHATDSMMKRARDFATDAEGSP